VRAAAAYTPVPGAKLLGVHLEGPFISPRFPGAQPAADIRPATVDEFLALIAAGPVRMITLAPEQPGAAALIAAARARDIVVVTGHTAATYAECEAAVELGVRQATHTYNAMTGLHHREPGTLGSILTNDRLDAQLIADNVHVHPAAMQIVARCKGPDGILLITDAMRAAGLPPGRYELGGQGVTVENGECRLDNGTLAGSVLTLEVGLRNFLAASGWTLAHAWPVSSRTAARALGRATTLGTLTPGACADIVVLDAELEVVATLVDGELVYLRDPDRLTRA
jgi:N-acetylglucosamine-6-phosphate deacetylase